MADTLLQHGFSAGELSPDMYGRTDLAHYDIGVKLARNWFVDYHGGMVNRPGTELMAPVKHHDRKTRLIPFSFSVTDTYMIEFGHQYMRIYRNGGIVVESAQSVSGITQADPAVVTTGSSHGYSTGDQVYISGVIGMSKINGGPYTITVTSTTEFELDGVDSSGFDAYGSGGDAERIYEIATPYTEGDLFRLKYTQSADILTVTHPDYDQREISRTGHTSWTISTPAYANDVDKPTGLTLNRTDFNRRSIQSIAQTNPCEVYISSVSDFSLDDEVLIRKVNGMTQINDGIYPIVTDPGLTGDHLEIGADATGWDAYTDGGICYKVPETGTTVRYKIAAVVGGLEGLPSSTASIDVDDPWPNGARVQLTWDAVTDADRYVIYKNSTGYWGFIGEAVTTDFEDDNIRPELFDSPSNDRDPFSGSGNKPQTVTYHQQRIVFAGATNWPAGIEMSQIGFFHNFGRAVPPQADDAISYSIVSREVNEIRHLLSLGQLIALTSGGEWILTSGQDAEVTPSNVGARAQTYDGCSHVMPLIIGNTALFIQDGGRTVRDLAYSLDVDGFQGTDLTVRSSHLFRGREIIDWTFAKEPHRLVWVVTDDGRAYTLTYVRDQKVWAWTQHRTDGWFESVQTVREGVRDVPYFVVRRTVGGNTRRFVERMADREINDVVDGFFVDCGLSYDGRNTDDSITLELTNGGDWSYYTNATLTISGDTWTDAIEDDWFKLRATDSNGDPVSVQVLVLTYDSTTTATVRLLEDAPSALQGNATSDWDQMVGTLRGADHLVGKSLSVLADGNVEEVTVADDGSFDLQRPAAVIHAGLGYQSDVELLDIAIDQGKSTARTRPKLLGKITMLVKDTRGLMAGKDTDHLKPVKPFYPRTYDTPLPTVTGLMTVDIPGQWDDEMPGAYIRQPDPLPATILSTMPEVSFGG